MCISFKFNIFQIPFFYFFFKFPGKRFFEQTEDYRLSFIIVYSLMGVICCAVNPELHFSYKAEFGPVSEFARLRNGSFSR